MGNTASAHLNDDLHLLVSTSLVDMLTQKIRANIYSGKYEANKKLIVRELAEEFGVSHTPIKDALNRLVAEGYVEAPPRRSMYVRSYSNAMLLDSMYVRLMFEISCANEIIQEASKRPEVHEEMEQSLNNMKELAKEGAQMSYEMWVQGETRFHNCYMNLCKNDQIYKLYQMIDTNRISYFTYLNTNNAPLRMDAIAMNIVEHQEILEAIGGLDPKRFMRASFQHIFRVAEDYVVDEECRKKFQRLQDYRTMLSLF